MCIKLILCYKSILAIVEKQIPIFPYQKVLDAKSLCQWTLFFVHQYTTKPSFTSHTRSRGYHHRHDLGWGNSSSICSRTPTFIEMSSCTSSLAAYGIVMAVTSRVLLHVWQ